MQGSNTRCVEIACNRCGAWAQITVRDHGPGLSDQAQARLFEPFFTTRPVGQGRGLGLSSAYRFVASHGGRIVVRSRLGRGTCFRVTLPLAPTR